MSYEKIAHLVDSLIINTNNGKIKWKESKLDEGAFEYSFINSSVLIGEGRTRNGSCIFLYIYNNEGQLIEEISDEDLVQYFETPYKELSSLYHTARRQAMGVEDALDEMLTALPEVPKNISLIERKKLKDNGPQFPSEADPLADVPF